MGHVDVDVLDSPTGPLGLLGLISRFTQFTLFIYIYIYIKREREREGYVLYSFSNLEEGSKIIIIISKRDVKKI